MKLIYSLKISQLGVESVLVSSFPYTKLTHKGFRLHRHPLRSEANTHVGKIKSNLKVHYDIHKFGKT